MICPVFLSASKRNSIPGPVGPHVAPKSRRSPSSVTSSASHGPRLRARDELAPSAAESSFGVSGVAAALSASAFAFERRLKKLTIFLLLVMSDGLARGHSNQNHPHRDANLAIFQQR